MDVSDFDYFLPPEAIAQRPAPRGTARLLTLGRATGAVAHGSVADLPGLLRPGDLLVVNDTKVIAARIFGTDEKGRRTEFLLVREDRDVPSRGEEAEGERWLCLAKPGRRVKAGRRFLFERGWEATALDRSGSPSPSPHAPSTKPAVTDRSGRGLYALRFLKRGSRDSLLADLPSLGSAPLPPYIHRPGGMADARDRDDYQTVYAESPGAIAAPTAGLHFTPALLDAVARGGVGTTGV
ncbi:MAG TPA: S-adenosylmethionine:tRNA ribosyltransferase-isomerase, partial [Thermoanaerobaculia bacterium]|nr:S-adenosylmethionine:tRNA ribosyltransferase-isomerase [Thermoanaerobaculia bacterium]